jgi:hypothetical protein
MKEIVYQLTNSTHLFPTKVINWQLKTLLVLKHIDFNFMLGPLNQYNLKVLYIMLSRKPENTHSLLFLYNSGFLETVKLLPSQQHDI